MAPSKIVLGIVAWKGETDDPDILQLRAQQTRNFLVSLLLAQGVPMILGGDEMGRTQQGNNNPYCHDNEISWFDWTLTTSQDDLLQFTRQLIAFRQQHSVFRQRHWLGTDEIGWFDPEGRAIAGTEQATPIGAFSMYIHAQSLPGSGTLGGQNSDFMLCMNAQNKTIEFKLPEPVQARQWTVVIDTTQSNWIEGDGEDRQALAVEGRSMLVLKLNGSLSEN